jgi:hypothetical protein
VSLENSAFEHTHVDSKVKVVGEVKSAKTAHLIAEPPDFTHYLIRPRVSAPSAHTPTSRRDDAACEIVFYSGYYWLPNDIAARIRQIVIIIDRVALSDTTGYNWMQSWSGYWNGRSALYSFQCFVVEFT